MLDQLLVIIGITILVLLSPGPDMVIVIRNTLTGGRRGGLLTSLGVLSGNLVHISYCVLGIGWIISQSIFAFNIMKFAGAAYLLFLGIASWRAAPARLDTDSCSVSQRRSWFLQGFINNVLNPKGALFYLGVFTMVITPATPVAVTVLLIATMNLICALFWLVFVTTLDRRAVRKVIERSQTAVNRVFGGLLVFLGIRVALLER